MFLVKEGKPLPFKRVSTSSQVSVKNKKRNHIIFEEGFSFLITIRLISDL